MWAFLAIIGSILFAADVLVWWRGDVWTRNLPRRRVWRVGWTAFVCFNIAMILLLMLGGRIGINRGSLPKMILIGTFVWHLLVLPAMLLLMFLGTAGTALVKGIRLARNGTKDKSISSPPESIPSRLSRRQFLSASAIAVPPLVTVIGTGIAANELQSFRVRNVVLPLRSLPRELDGLKIAQICDVHVGDFTNGPLLKRIAEASNQLKPDLVLMPGDLINRRLTDLPAALDMVRTFDSKFGLYMCEGNHDLFEDPDEFAATVRAAKVPLLVDQTENLQINGRAVQVMGMQWGVRRGRGEPAFEASMQRLNATRQPDAFPILLSHHPHAFDIAKVEGIPLTLAGHTHGGQLMLTKNFGFGPAMYRYWSGLYRDRSSSGDSAMFVSNGVGNWFPMRINAPAEIISLTLRRDA